MVGHAYGKNSGYLRRENANGRQSEDRRADAIHGTACSHLDCFAEPVNGREAARPVGSQ
jgi:hypothetical protein